MQHLKNPLLQKADPLRPCMAILYYVCGIIPGWNRSHGRYESDKDASTGDFSGPVGHGVRCSCAAREGKGNRG